MMQVELRIRNADLVNILRGYTDRRLRFALSRFGDRVGRVVVSVSECNDADAGIVKSCHISAELRPFGQVAAREIAPDLYTAINRAAGRVGRLFALRLGRRKAGEVARTEYSVVRPRGVASRRYGVDGRRGGVRKTTVASKRPRRSPRRHPLQTSGRKNLDDRRKRRTILESPRHKRARSRRKGCASTSACGI